MCSREERNPVREVNHTGGESGVRGNEWKTGMGGTEGKKRRICMNFYFPAILGSFFLAFLSTAPFLSCSCPFMFEELSVSTAAKRQLRAANERKEQGRAGTANVSRGVLA